ncbi:hypothetical protein [Legionella bononiensis]|uniref:Dot/Icm T4SS effector n=1 Tax=Legionella bononiensis TaxID=2793102 RepID=A0ABS1W9Z1_9GAMM|nr:hypothetical protein [Legionella bononiensis]MBL7480620.1 hypothetical protein [Legionella bononiensis]MBL7526181.1 hypothetical protein [Legionella bononiensis]MBL7563324.1 hypothetical protein [Legionella bononiensis]
MPELTYEKLNLSKKDEYFVAIGKQGIHSFMMLGVMKDGSPKLLTRVGKQNDVGPDSQMTKIVESLGDGTLSRLVDEGISRKPDSVRPMSYQAYSINYDQAKDFMGLISDVEKKQIANPNIKKGMMDLYNAGTSETTVIHKEAIRSYVPTQEEGDNVTFEWKKLNECDFSSTVKNKDKDKDKISEGVQHIQVSNTCRTTALNIVEAILGFTTDISKYFFVSPKYETTLVGGQPNKDSFYILPPPPTVNKEHFSAQQLDTLNKLYKRLEEIPKLNPDSKETHDKFEALKSTYKDIMGENNLSANDLLKKVLEHEKSHSEALYTKREPNFFSRLFSIESSTEQLFKDFKKNFQNEMDKVRSQVEVNEENSEEQTDLVALKPHMV